METQEGTSFFDAINSLFGTVANVYGGITNAQTAAAQAKAERAKAQAAAAGMSKRKMVIIGLAIVAGIVALVFVFKRH